MLMKQNVSIDFKKDFLKGKDHRGRFRNVKVR